MFEISQVIGFRVNQIDGLADPETYSQELRRHAGEKAYLVADKILLDGEPYPLHGMSMEPQVTSSFR